MFIINGFISGLFKWYDYTGRTSRKDYLSFELIRWIVCITYLYNVFSADNIMDYVTGTSGQLYSLTSILILFMIIAGLSLQVRRLHDTGRSGYWLFLIIIPFGFILLLIFLFSKSDGDNKYSEANQKIKHTTSNVNTRHHIIR